jgi:UDP-GlcNAc:undecaprenyl-phosphate GlcNAc-1-phosphate transferase
MIKQFLKQCVLHDGFLLYTLAFFMAVVLSFLLCPVFRWLAIRYNVLDRPSSPIKTHINATPYLGGCAIVISFVMSLTIMRLLSDYPTGTLRPIKGIFYGGFLIFLLGLVDDVIAGGLSFKEKFVVQFAASAVLIFFGIQINFIHPNWLAWVTTLIWVTGIANAFNIIDIMDGLSASTALVAALAFLFISLPTEQIYVNFTSVVLAGSILGFLPYNFSKKKKMFMGDTGSLFIGYVLAAVSLGTSYTTLHNAGVVAPLLILGVPIYDTIFVMLLRLRKGMSPFLGSKDHFALRLEKLGFSRIQIVGISIAAATVLSLCAWLTTRIWFWAAVGLYAVVFIIYYFIGAWLAKVSID